MVRTRWLAALGLALALVALAGAAASAQDRGSAGVDVVIPKNHPGPDPDAPDGAPVSWLPNEPWVRNHWLPYRERDLWRTLHTNRAELRVWLRHKPLADLARAKGVDPGRALTRLLLPVRREFPGRNAALADHARRTFNQRHLMQHMLFHPFHIPAFNADVPRLLGYGWPQINAMRRQGLSLADIARRRHRDPHAAMLRIRAGLLAASRLGVRRRETPRAQARDFTAEQRRMLPKRWHGRMAGDEHMDH
jgi:hypothetical protein